MKKVHLCFIVIHLIILQSANSVILAQVPVPEIKNISKDIFVSLPGNTGSVNITIDNYPFGIDIARINSNTGILAGNQYQQLFIITDTVAGRISGLSPKTGAGNESSFYILLDDGSIYLSSVTGNASVSQPVLIGKDALYHGSYNFGKLKGDALYWLNANYIDLSRDGGTTWQTDSSGLGGQSIIDFDIDAGQSVYAVSSTQLYKQAPASNTWFSTSFPNGVSPSSIFIDNTNRILVGTSLFGIYYSTDTGHTWQHTTSGLNSVVCGKFCEDVLGNIYMMDGDGSAIYRSTDEGVDWTRVDETITGMEKDPNYTTIINDITADSVVCAATIYGMFASADQGNTWTAVNHGLMETQFNGFLLNSSGRLVETSNNGLFYKNSSDTVFTKILPDTAYAYAGPLFADALGNIYTRASGPVANTTKLILKSADYGITWQPDTAGLWQITNETAFGVDEYGYEHIADNASTTQTIIYNKIPGTSFLPDTGGIGTSLGTFSTVTVFASDDNGNLYLAGNMGNNASCWRRIIGGGNWVPDTIGLPSGTVLQSLTHDIHHNMIANASLPTPTLYNRQGGTWSGIPFPTFTGYVAISAVAADNSNGIIVAFNSYTQNTNDVVGLGIYCTHNLGFEWSFVGFKGPTVYSLVTVGDTVYALSNRGIYALTCNGVVNDPTGVPDITPDKVIQLRIFPNPASGLCHALFSTDFGKNELSITDMTGRLIKTYDIGNSSGEFIFSTSGLSHGLYFCILRNDEKILAVQKLVVE